MNCCGRLEQEELWETTSGIPSREATAAHGEGFHFFVSKIVAEYEDLKQQVRKMQPVEITTKSEENHINCVSGGSEKHHLADNSNGKEATKKETRPSQETNRGSRTRGKLYALQHETAPIRRASVISTTFETQMEGDVLCNGAGSRNSTFAKDEGDVFCNGAVSRNSGFAKNDVPVASRNSTYDLDIGDPNGSWIDALGHMQLHIEATDSDGHNVRSACFAEDLESEDSSSGGGDGTGTISLRRFGKRKTTRASYRWKQITSMLLAGWQGNLFNVQAIWAQKQNSSILCETGSVGDQMDIVQSVWNKEQEKLVVRSAARRTTLVLTALESPNSSFIALFRNVWPKDWIIHPHSGQRLAWVVMGMLFLTMDFMILSFQVFGLDMTKGFWVGCEWCGAGYWTFDIFVSCLTGVRAPGSRLENILRITKRYMRTWFLFDFPLVVVQWVHLVVGEDGVEGSTMLRYARFARYSRLLRLAKAETFISQFLELVNSMLVILAVKMSLYLLCVLAYVHASATIWYWVGGRSDDGWIYGVLQGEHDKLPLNYLVSAGWAASQLQGNTNIYPSWHNTAENAFALLQNLVSVVVLAALVSKLTTVLQHIQVIKSNANRQLNSARRYLEDNCIDTILSLKVRNYIEKMLKADAKRNQQDEQDLLHILPRDMRKALLLQIRVRPLVKHLLFRAFKETNLRVFEIFCCELPETKCTNPDENIFSRETVCKHIFVITKGEFEYLRMSEVLQSVSRQTGGFLADTTRSQPTRATQIKSGTLLSEAAFWVEWVHMGDLESVDHGSILSFNVNEAHTLVYSCPSMQEAMRWHGRRFAQLLLLAVFSSDLVTTEFLFLEEAKQEALGA